MATEEHPVPVLEYPSKIFFLLPSVLSGLARGQAAGVWRPQCAQGAPQAGARIADGERPFGQLPANGPHPPTRKPSQLNLQTARISDADRRRRILLK